MGVPAADRRPETVRRVLEAPRWETGEIELPEGLNDGYACHLPAAGGADRFALAAARAIPTGLSTRLRSRTAGKGGARRPVGGVGGRKPGDPPA